MSYPGPPSPRESPSPWPSEPPLGLPWTAAALAERLGSPYLHVREWAALRLAERFPQEFTAHLAALLRGPDPALCRLAVEFIGTNSLHEHSFQVFRLFRDVTGALRGSCAQALGQLGYLPALPDLEAWFSRPDFQDIPTIVGVMRGLYGFPEPIRERLLQSFCAHQRWRQYPLPLAYDGFVSLLTPSTSPELLCKFLLEVTWEYPQAEHTLDWWLTALRRLPGNLNPAFLTELYAAREYGNPQPLQDLAEAAALQVAVESARDSRKLLRRWDTLMEEGLWADLLSEVLWSLRRLAGEFGSTGDVAEQARFACALADAVAERQRQLLRFAEPFALVLLGVYLSLSESLALPMLTEAGRLVESLGRPLLFAPAHEEALLRAAGQQFATAKPVQEFVYETLAYPADDAPLIRAVRLLACHAPEHFPEAAVRLWSNPDLSATVLEMLGTKALLHAGPTLAALRPLPRYIPPSLYPDLLRVALAAPETEAVRFLLENVRKLEVDCLPELLETIGELGSEALFGFLSEGIAGSHAEHYLEPFVITGDLHQLGEHLLAGPRQALILARQAMEAALPELSLFPVQGTDGPEQLELCCEQCGARFLSPAQEILTDPDTLHFFIGEPVLCTECGAIDTFTFPVETRARLMVRLATSLCQGQGHALHETPGGVRLCTFSVDGEPMGPRKAMTYLEQKLLQGPRRPDDLVLLGRIYQLQRATPNACTCFHEALEVERHYVEADYFLGRIAREDGRLAEMRTHFERVWRLHEQGRALWGATNPQPILDDIRSTLARVVQLQE